MQRMPAKSVILFALAAILLVMVAGCIVVVERAGAGQPNGTTARSRQASTTVVHLPLIRAADAPSAVSPTATSFVPTTPASPTSPAATATPPGTSTTPTPVDPFHVLVFSKTAGFRHAAIPDGIAAIKQLGAQHNFVVDATEDAAVFSDDQLEQYKVVVFLMTTGDVLNAACCSAFERFIRAGNGYVGVHSASDTEYDWLWYGQLVGAYFQSHPLIQAATLAVEDRAHPSTAHLPQRWQRTDEWYNFRTNPHMSVNVLLSLDEATYVGGNMGDHPLAWYHTFDGGRAWYTGMGHTQDSYAESLFMQHLLGGIQYAAGM